MINQWNIFLQKLSNKQIVFVFFVISFLVYGNTLSHQYALDDAIVITQNKFTSQGFSGIDDIFSTESFTGFFGKKKELVAGGRYRPFSIITFAIEYELFGLNPFISHLVNILLYALLCSLAFLVFHGLLKCKVEQNTARIIAFIASLVFLIHPVHTEVVANIKGRDEILGLIFSLLSFYLIIKPYKNILLGYLIVILSFFLALLSKENAIAFVVIIPVALWYFKKSNIKQAALILMLFLFPSVVFLIIRHAVLGGFSTTPVAELMNNPFLHADGAEKIATVLYTWIIYFKLLIFPHPLTFDYYPYHIPLVDFSNPIVWFSVAIVVGLVVVFFKGLRKKTLLSFSVFAFAASFVLMSNLFFTVGTFMNERFVFVASLFWCFALAFLVIELLGKRNKLKYLILILGLYMLVFYPVKTIARNTAWKNDLTLFTTDVKTSANSAKSNCSAGGKLWEEGKVTKNKQKQAEYYLLSEKYLRKAVQIYPSYTDAWLLLGNVLFDSKKDIEASVNCYLSVLKRYPQHENALKNIDIVLQQSDDRNLQLKKYSTLLNMQPDNYLFNYRLGVIYGRYMNDLTKGIVFLEKAVKTNPNKIEALKDLGTAYGMSGQVYKAYETFKKAVKLDSTDYQMYVNLGVSCRQLGKNAEASLFFKKAESLKK